MLPKVYGVTIDSIDSLSDILQSLKSLAKRPTVRIVFDPMRPEYYLPSVKAISEVADVMGQILDSSEMKNVTVQSYITRTKKYLSVLGSYVKIWEIGNEINGEWLGQSSKTVAKIQGAYDVLKPTGAILALTGFHNAGCEENVNNEMFKWITKYIPLTLRQGIDYALISYYDDDCPRPRPNWDIEFKRFGDLFPNSKLGFGECGTAIASKKADYVNYFYKLIVNHPRYIMGNFWWYYKQDAVPMSKPLWSVINNTFN